MIYIRAARFAVVLVAMAVTGCLPYPVQSPRVEPGITLTTGMGLRPFATDTVTPNGGRPGPFFLPEFTFSPSIGFAREDGTGPAFRAGATLGLPGPFNFDVYGQVPRVGPFVGGAGAMLTSLPLPLTDSARISAASPYAAIGWQVGEDAMLYGSLASLPIHRSTRGESNLTTRVIVIGYQRRRELDNGVASWRAFLALFHGNQGIESVPVLLDGGGPIPVHSLFVAGFSHDATRPWSWFDQPGRPRRRPF